MQTLEALVDSSGTIKLLKNIRLPKDRRALVTILDEEPKENSNQEAAEKKKKLFAAFKKLVEKDIFHDIQDPDEWQRSLRGESER